MGESLIGINIGLRYPNLYPSGPAYKYYTREIAEECLSYAESTLREEIFEKIETYVKKKDY